MLQRHSQETRRIQTSGPLQRVATEATALKPAADTRNFGHIIESNFRPAQTKKTITANTNMLPVPNSRNGYVVGGKSKSSSGQIKAVI
jgi:hypothetical protein